MRKFLTISIIIICVISALHTVVIFLADGTTDPYYLRFTTPKAQSLVIGSSRAATGIVPPIVDSVIGKDLTYGIFNFAFSGTVSPYGPTYLEAVKKKIRDDTVRGLFLLEINARAIFAPSINPNNEKLFPEKDFILHKVKSVSQKPNFAYFINYYPYGWGRILLNKIKKPSYLLHEDGWLEINLNPDASHVENRIKQTMKVAREFFSHSSLSKTRLAYFEKTIKYLKEHGDVFIFRMPLDEDYLKMEQSFLPEIDSITSVIAAKHDIQYLNFTMNSNKYITYDGHHLHPQSAKNFTANLSNVILKEMQLRNMK